MSLTIKEVTTSKDLKQFIKFPYKLYKNHKYWVPPLYIDEVQVLRKDKNPAFEFCDAKYWIALKDDVVVGRIAGILNRTYNEIWNKKSARFGWVDFIDDTDVSKLLFDTVENWAREIGMEDLHGPLGFTDMDPEGMLIEGFEELGTMAAIYNYPYYHEHIKKYKYEKDADWIEFNVEVPKEYPEKVERIAALSLKRYKLRKLEPKSKKDLLPYARGIFDVINAAYKDLYGFVPLSEKQIDTYTKQYFGFIKHEFVPVIVNEADEVVAFGITMPSLSRALQKGKGRLFPFGFIYLLNAMRKSDLVDLYLTAVRPDFQDKGINAVVMLAMNKTLLKHKIYYVESNPELETNNKVQAQWKHYNARQHKRRRCFKKVL